MFRNNQVTFMFKKKETKMGTYPIQAVTVFFDFFGPKMALASAQGH